MNEPKPPTSLVVLDPQRRELVAQRDLRASWALTGCGLPYFELVGIHEQPGIALFQSRIGMTSHACDGHPEPVVFRVIRF